MHRRSLCLAFALGLGACYHVAIETGAPATEQVIRENWSNGFLFGLVPPDVMMTASRCPNGVSKVETEHSFLNVLATAVTVGLYTPVTVAVTCSDGPVKVPPPRDDVRENRTPGRSGGQGGRGRGGIGGRGGRPPEDSVSIR
jgi:hypothetical protein